MFRTAEMERGDGRFVEGKNFCHCKTQKALPEPSHSKPEESLAQQ